MWPQQPFWILKTNRLTSLVPIPQIRTQIPGYPARRLITLPVPVICFTYFHSCQRLRPRALFWLTAWILAFIHTAHLKCLDRLQQSVFPLTLKKIFHINICSEVSDFWCNCNVTFNNKYINYVMFYLKLTHIYSVPAQFNNFSVLVVYRITIHNKCPKCPPSDSIHVWPLLIMDYRTISMLLGPMWMGKEA
jgi:hypothetical protein